MTPALTVERASPAEWERVRTIRLRALRDAPDSFWTTFDEDAVLPATFWQERLADAARATFIARVGDGDVGVAVGAPHHDGDGDAGLYSVWVARDARGTGVGAALVAAVIAWARGAGYERLRLDVGDHNEAAIALYARAGFVPTGVTNSFPPPREHITEHERVLDLRR